MATIEHLIARLLHQFEAGGLSTDVTEGLLHTGRWLGKLIAAVPA